MIKTKSYILFSIAVMLSNHISGQASNKIVTGEKHVIHSELMGKDKEYWIHLPRGYDESNDSYPVLYITDGEEHFHLATGTTEFMSSQYVIPETIVVALLHGDRNHDLTPTHSKTNLEGFESDAAKVSGGGENLLQFIEQDLIPEIESNYRTGPYRILAGHSLGGLFSVYAFLTRNRLFNVFIAMDPALPWDNRYCERLLKNSFDSIANSGSKLYIASAHNAPIDKADRSPFRLSQNSFSKALKSKGIYSFRHDYFETQNHLTAPYVSLYAGLAYAFPKYYFLESQQFSLEVPTIVTFYKQQSEKYGITSNPPERLMEMFGNYFLLDKNDYKGSIPFFEKNAINYPYHYKNFENLGKAYIKIGMTDTAISNFKKALELCPENTDIQKILTDLEITRNN